MNQTRNANAGTERVSALVMPPEWAPQEWLWIGFPHARDEWLEYLEPAQEQIAAFANAVAESGQEVRLLVRDEVNEARARSLVNARVTLEQRVFGDIWLRDTGPLIVKGNKRREARRFAFNGWGNKFVMAGDETIGAELARDADLTVRTSPMVLEGGAIDGDGTGLAITTEQCLMHSSRSPFLNREDMEQELAQWLGLDRLVWLGDGLINDHTDGHVDNLARFVAPGKTVLPEATDDDDPNAAIYADAAQRLKSAGIAVARIPSPGRFEREHGVEPASYVNFAITTHLVVVPTFGSPRDAEGVAAIAEHFPDRATIGLPADAVLAGGGGLHCASQQMPRA